MSSQAKDKIYKIKFNFFYKKKIREAGSQCYFQSDMFQLLLLSVS